MLNESLGNTINHVIMNMKITEIMIKFDIFYSLPSLLYICCNS